MKSVVKVLQKNRFHHDIKMIGNRVIVSYDCYPVCADKYHVVDKAWRDFREMLKELKNQHDLRVNSENCIFPIVGKPGWKIVGIKE